MLGHTTLQHYYTMIFALAQHHKYQISEIENLIPYERDIYFSMLVDFIKRVEELNRNKQ